MSKPYLFYEWVEKVPGNVVDTEIDKMYIFHEYFRK